ncbi:hypothetical protein BJ508DRAFT_308077 [Ascobolus immersus RN42]|uniref:Uncharacterized protein n=1 Tax=Ascobolus immersus RN42 TaxID=1160509 RepID=A0A3N4I500_ASCIM|nr:hypothetical protein BJ508DRAFT_308077 [Ascobolus immersus RN42]
MTSNVNTPDAQLVIAQMNARLQAIVANMEEAKSDRDYFMGVMRECRVDNRIEGRSRALHFSRLDFHHNEALARIVERNNVSSAGGVSPTHDAHESIQLDTLHNNKKNEYDIAMDKRIRHRDAICAAAQRSLVQVNQYIAECKERIDNAIAFMAGLGIEYS